jgi:hypothetical protein
LLYLPVVFDRSYSAYTFPAVVAGLPSLDKEGQGWLDPVLLKKVLHYNAYTCEAEATEKSPFEGGRGMTSG